ncbi:serine O-acetyltransferase [Buchnera aphidicola (Kurisakia onigurumii)]|uniref:serine O-acetyltransferase n=1 Tax=Buchnera aphidicola TaxID=9 RepID=UPI0031B6EF65
MIAKKVHNIWKIINKEVQMNFKKEKELKNFYKKNIFEHQNIFQSLVHILAIKLQTPTINYKNIKNIIFSLKKYHANFQKSIQKDLIQIFKKDPVVKNFYIPFLYFKGFHALQAYRISHYLWKENRKSLALFLQNQISIIFSVDIHPAAKIGNGIILDHATGIVIGETAIVEDNVSIFHSVTLGGKKYILGDRHPKIRQGVIIGAGAKIIGNIEIGFMSKIGAGSVVLTGIPPFSIAVGVPAKIIRKK